MIRHEQRAREQVELLATLRALARDAGQQLRVPCGRGRGHAGGNGGWRAADGGGKADKVMHLLLWGQ